ncbi:MAG: M20 family metallopeptidase [Salinisphaera sp.]|jgi:amidohydrolase|nr:M20 family metallopeptidase [Salinisphaera sp.]
MSTSLKAIEAFHDDLREWRRDLHAHPEIGFEEERTANFIADRLEEFGIETTRGLAGTGIVGTLRNGSSQRAIGLRADIDALPMDEDNTFAHRSQNPGRMHACGHDGHTTMLLGAARYLAEHRDFDGTVHFIFQPAEEGLGGGKRMIEDGLFEQFPVDGVYGMHNWPGLATGRFGICAGAIMASCDFFDLTITGKGGHAAMPHLGVDPFVAVGQLLSQLQSLPARRFNASRSPAVVSVTQVHGGSAYNVIPDTVKISGTVRALDEETRRAIEPMFQDMAAGIGRATGTTIGVDYRYINAATFNHAAETENAARGAAQLVGENRVDRDLGPSMGAEDFAYMLEATPGAYIWLGNGENSAALHNTSYDFDDSISPLGAAYWVELTRSLLSVTG